ncbi:hypothetical protein [Limnochorda pilosa]|uniref:Uncharacterized protein n=1 Tax=Limnochorda pilosa TaxID=1555112 RepID=A0A0K2SKP8_LIMPI|nr:hypothetical protein [Limnochorda pilosa]BAS27660.1 hypothetical protein LIP_1816 [Limnochorda pilosa]
MKLFGMRLHVVLVVFGLALAAAFGGQYLYVHRQVEAPLASEIASLDGVEDVALEAAADGAYQVKVRLAPGVRLPDLYEAIRERVELRLGVRTVVELEDRRTAELVSALDSMQFALQEGAATGRLEAMRQRVEELAAASGVEARLFVDASRIYVTLEKGDGYLYEVIGRRVANPAGADGNAGAGRGGA